MGGAIVCLLVAAGPARADDGSPWSAVGRFFSFDSATPSALSAAIDALAEGRSFGALATSAGVLDDHDAGVFADDAAIVRALALSDLGWNDLAATAFDAVLDVEPVSVYYPLALLGVVEAHRQEGRGAAIAATCDRRTGGEDGVRERRIAGLLEAFGELRPGSRRLTREENELVENPSRLGEGLSRARERVTDRLLYLCGQAYFALGRHRDGVRVLDRIGLVSPYHRYALYTSAQAFHAMGETEEAIATVHRLLVLPPGGTEGVALSARAVILQAQLLFESGRTEAALRAAGSVSGTGFHALQARLLRGDLCLESEQPGLAVTYYRELAAGTLLPALEAGRGLGLGAAYAALGDLAAATDVLRASAARVGDTRREVGSREEEASRLLMLALRDARRSSAATDAERRQLAKGIRGVIALEGSSSLGRLVRMIFMSHRNTVLGAPLEDFEVLAAGAPLRRDEPVSAAGLWADYLGSPERATVKRALSRRVALEDASEGEAGLRAIDALLDAGRLDHAARLVAELRREGFELPALVPDLDAPTGPQAEAWRRAVTAVAGEMPLTLPAVDRARAAAIEAVTETAVAAIRRFLETRDDRLRRIQYDLTVALSQLLAGTRSGLRPDQRRGG